jgi:hypothetical protein
MNGGKINHKSDSNRASQFGKIARNARAEAEAEAPDNPSIRTVQEVSPARMLANEFISDRV